jgi:putative membrane protein
MRDRFVLPVIGGLSLAVVLAIAFVIFRAPAAPRGVPTAPLLPTVNASLNGASAVLLVAGYVCIRRRNVAAHRACMLGAFTASAIFLISYLVYHARAGSVHFTGVGWLRAVYFPLLVSHIMLSAVVLPLALTTIYRAWNGEIARHRRIARFTLPVWLYVSVTGVVVYAMLYYR